MISSQSSALPPPGAHISPSSGGRGGPGEEIKPSPPLGGRDVRGGKEGGRAVRGRREGGREGEGEGEGGGEGRRPA